jgi:hypothetical protein
MRVLVIMNHVHPELVPRVRRQFSRFDDVCIATPPGGEGDIDYYTGSFTYQSAVVQYLRSYASPDTGQTLVVHEDVALAADLSFLSQFDDTDDRVLCHDPQLIRGRLFPGWDWNFRVLASWSQPMDSAVGSGVTDSPEVLRRTRLYKQHEYWFSMLGNATFDWTVGDSSIPPPANSLLRSWFGGNSGDHMSYDFGLPLFYGFSDYFTFPNSIAADVEQFLSATVSVGLFAEVAVPTMLVWLGRELVRGAETFDLLWGHARDSVAHITSDLALVEYFAARPGVFGVHPVDLSRFAE